MEKLQLFRKLNERLPTVAEKVIGHWGSAELDAYIDQLIREAPSSGLGLSDDLIQVLRDLKVAHVEEFPRFAALAVDAVVARLSELPDFRLIQGGFPHVANQMVATWGRRSFHWYIESLFNDKTRPNRRGFPEEVVMAIFHLSQLHDAENPDAVAVNRDIWANHDEHGLRLI